MKQGWEIKKLGEVCKIQTGKLDANAKVDDGVYPFFTCDAKPYRINTYAFDDEAILISGNGSLVGHINYYNGKFNAYQRTYVLTQFTSFHLPFLISYLKGFLRSYIIENKKGGCIPYITLPILQNFAIPCPPREEQERIAEILDREFEKIDALKENAEKNLQHAKDLFQSALKQELQPKEGWSTNKLNKVASYSIGLTYKPTDVSSLGTIVLRSSNIQNNKLCLNDIVRVNCAVKEHLFVGNGDILMCSRNGSAKLVGKVAVIDNIQEPMTFGTFMTIIKSEYNPLLLYFFMSKEFRKQINKGENTMINQITKYMLDDIIVSLPNNKSTMYEIVARLDKLQENCRTLEENYTKTIALCDDLKQALLRKAFNGEL